MVWASRKKWDDHIAISGAYAFTLGYIVRNLQRTRAQNIQKPIIQKPSSETPMTVYKGINLCTWEVMQYK